MKKGKNITVKHYKDIVLEMPKNVIRNLRPVTGFKHIRLLHDNVPALAYEIVLAFWKKEKVTVLPHLPYSLDLALCDFFMLSKLKKIHVGRKY